MPITKKQNTTVQRKQFIIPTPNWSREQWLQFYHINNEVPEHFGDFIPHPVWKRFCGCILSDSEAQQFQELFPELRVLFKSQATYGPANLNPTVIYQGYMVDETTGQLHEAPMDSALRHSFTFEKKASQRTY